MKNATNENKAESILHLVHLTKDCAQLKQLVWGYALASGLPAYGPKGLIQQVEKRSALLDIPTSADFAQVEENNALTMGTPELLRLKSFYDQVSEACEFDMTNLRPIYAYAKTMNTSIDCILPYRKYQSGV